MLPVYFTAHMHTHIISLPHAYKHTPLLRCASLLELPSERILPSMLHCHPVVNVAVAGMEVENKQQVCAFKYDHFISLIQSRDCRLIETKTRCK